MRASLSRRVPRGVRAALAGLGALGVLACGGADRGRPDEAPAGATVPDPGSGPFSCEPVPRVGFGPWGSDSFELEFWTLDDFETGAAQGGWYANSDTCEDCQKLMDARDAVAKLADRVVRLRDQLDRFEGAPDPNRIMNDVLIPPDPSQPGLKDVLFTLTDFEWRGAGGYPWGTGMAGMIGYVQDADPTNLELLDELAAFDEELALIAEHIDRLPDVDPEARTLTEDLDLTAPENAELLAALVGDANTLTDELATLGWVASDEPGELQTLTDRIIACKPPCDASETPNLFQKPLPAEEIPQGGRCGSQFAMHLRLRSGAVPALLPEREKDWGGQLLLDLAPPADASEWEGISFWARVGPGSRTTFRTELSDLHTADKYRDPETGRSICNPEAGDVHDNAEEGCDKFGHFVLANGDWQFFAVPFTELRQKGWGLRAPYLDVWGIWSVGFMFEPGVWDVWIDDVAFYRRTP